MEKELRETQSKLKNMIRVGVVSSINPSNGTAKVVFHEKGELVSGDLQIIFRSTLKNNDYQMPDIDEQVVCMFLESGLESGFIIGSVYSSDDVPPANSGDKWIKKFGDGTILEYDRAEHKLTANVNGTAEITAATITINGDIVLNGNLSVSGTTTTGGGINLNTHTHPDAQGGNTGGPQ